MSETIFIVIKAAAIILSLTLHEFAHAYVALLNGDSTAKHFGRLTLNPIVHIDLIGTVFLLIFGFGWAKPVPVNELNFKNTRLGILTVSVAGIVMNLITAFITAFLIVKFEYSNIYIHDFLLNFFTYSVVFAVFNLLPIPPLDGSKMIMSVLPSKFRYFIYKYENYGFILLMFLLSSKHLDNYLNEATSIVIKTIFSLL